MSIHWIDWAIVAAYLVWIVWDGLRLSKKTDQLDGYLLAGRSLPWWVVGLSVMATQLSAITLVGTTGQGYNDGMRFIQFYFGLPIAMIILSVTVVPFFYRSGVFTAYEYLEKRFDVKTRALASFIFLIQRGLGCGVIISAPAIILSIILGWNFTLTVLAIGMPTAIYTMFGGVQAVAWTDVKQMVIIVAGVVAAVVVLILGLPDGVSTTAALHVAGSVGKLQALDFSLDQNNTYTVWSGVIGGLFLMLGYFGCDQSQVQRYLTSKSVDEGRHSLLMSAFVKIPLQVLILLTGVLTFVFFLFHQAPMLFNPQHTAKVMASPRAAEYQALQQEYDQRAVVRSTAAAALAQASDSTTGDAAARQAFTTADAAVKEVRGRATLLVQQVSGDKSYKDVNYVFPTFIIQYMPVGLIGLMLAAIFAAAMSSIAAELNALATATTIDFYKRHVAQNATEAQALSMSKWATGVWGLFACGVAVYAANLGSLIEVVNRFGSFFYGSLLGVFILAFGVKRANGQGAFVGLIAGLVAVTIFAWLPQTKDISFLWYNVVGALAVTVVGVLVSAMTGGNPDAHRTDLTFRT
jgi:SSS family solute:Na+ symporter